MKKKYIGLIGIMLATISLASCSFVDVLNKKIKSITISDDTSAYVIGDSYFDKSTFKINAKYFDNTPAPISKDDVAFNFVLDNKAYDINKPLSVAGEYKLSVSKDNVTSNTITISVLASEQYVSNITVNGSNNVEKGRYINLSLSVSPSIYTVDIECENSSTLVDVTKISNNSYRIKGLEVGNATISFKAKNSESTYLSVPFSIEVTPNYKTEIKQTYNDFVKNNYYSISSCPLEGNVKLLVIPVWFSDSDSYINESKKEYVRKDIEKAYFGDPSEIGWESVSSFYKKESEDRLNLTGTVSEWYSSSLTSLTVGAYKEEEVYKTSNLVKSATDWYFSNHTSDSRKNYDSDGDGYLDGVMVIYGAPDYRAYSGYDATNMWAYCYWLSRTSEKSISNPGLNVYFWASYDFMYSQSKALERTGHTYNSGDTSHCTVDAHTFIHEMGHVFGLEDYYDYYEPNRTNPAAGFSMQDNNVGGHDPFSLMAFGWADPKIPTSSSTIWINDFQSSHDLILLSNNWNYTYNSPFDEYILLELYSNTGLNKFDSDYRYSGAYPQGPKDIGIRVWHVDARLLQLSGFPYATSGKFTSTPDVKNTSRIVHAFNNTSNASKRKSEAYTYLGQEDYQKMNLLQLIRNSTSKTYTDNFNLSSYDLFKQGSSFSMSTFSKQFVNGNKLDNGLDLGWSFNVKTIISNNDGTYSAEIELIKA